MANDQEAQVASVATPASGLTKAKLRGGTAIVLALLAGGGWLSISKEAREWVRLYLDVQESQPAGNATAETPTPSPSPPKADPTVPGPPAGTGETQVSVERTASGIHVKSTGPASVKVDGIQIDIPPPPPPPAYVPPPPEPVPPPPPPEPVPPPPPPACVAGPFMVFFDWDKDDITPQAAAILDNAASAYQTCGQAQVMIAGHADRSGSDQYNVGLSQRRAANVRSYLAGRSLPDGVMTTEAFGESRPLVETADGVREPQNRRVEVTFGPGPGW